METMYNEIWQALELNLKGDEKSQRTIDEYAQAWGEFTAWLAETDNEISAKSVDRFKVVLKDGWHPADRPEENRRPRGDATRTKLIRGIRRVLYFAAKRGFIEKFEVSLPQVNETQEKRALTLDQVDQIARCLDGHHDFSRIGNPDDKVTVYRWTLQERLRFWLIAETGMRAGEALKINWSHVDIDRGVINIPRAKTKARTVSINTLWGKLKPLVEEVEDKTGTVLKARGNKPLKHQGLRKFFDKLNAAVDLGTDLNDEGEPEPIEFRPHDLRRTFITLTLTQFNKPVNMVAQQVGHTNWTTTQLYDKSSIDDLVEIFNGHD